MLCFRKANILRLHLQSCHRSHETIQLFLHVSPPPSHIHAVGESNPRMRDCDCQTLNLTAS